MKFRWDITSFDVATLTISAGGTASPMAGDGSKISLTGNGTFGGKPTNVTGGGTWTTFDASGKQTGNGTYTVKSLISFIGGPGTLAGAPVTRGGLAALRIAYSDGAKES